MAGSNNGRTRGWLAPLIVLGGMGGIVFVSAIAIAFASDENRPEMARLVFASVLPLLGTWVGTVLAFYFARDNLDAATESTIRLSGGRVDPRTPVRQAMIPKEKILARQLQLGANPGDLVLGELYAEMTAQGRHRIPILDASGAVLYIVHDSTIASFTGVDETPGTSTKKMAELLDDAELKKAVEAIGIVGPDAVLSDARAAMRAVDRCNDVFVTTGGKKSDPIVGWLTNTDLAALE